MSSVFPPELTYFFLTHPIGSIDLTLPLPPSPTPCLHAPTQSIRTAPQSTPPCPRRHLAAHRIESLYSDAAAGCLGGLAVRVVTESSLPLQSVSSSAFSTTSPHTPLAQKTIATSLSKPSREHGSSSRAFLGSVGTVSALDGTPPSGRFIFSPIPKENPSAAVSGLRARRQ